MSDSRLAAASYLTRWYTEKHVRYMEALRNGARGYLDRCAELEAMEGEASPEEILAKIVEADPHVDQLAAAVEGLRVLRAVAGSIRELLDEVDPPQNLN